MGDAQRIAQVLTNLVGNAAKFSPEGTPIIISAHQTGEMIQLDVVDQGPGIPIQKRARVFESFSQLENGIDNHKKGAGLGLAICKGLIESQNGKIWIQDHSGTGTVISFTLPVYSEITNDTAN
jgi:two-component system sensor histidine kinase KdpD